MPKSRVDGEAQEPMSRVVGVDTAASTEPAEERTPVDLGSRRGRRRSKPSQRYALETLRISNSSHNTTSKMAFKSGRHAVTKAGRTRKGDDVSGTSNDSKNLRGARGRW